MKKKNKDSLVTEQPGRKILFSGIVASLILGFFIRGLTQPEFLQAELKSAVSRIHSSTQVTWGGALISLKNGWWPRFSVLVQDVKIVSFESCWGQPLLYARELELPISIFSFFENGQPFKTLYVRDAFLELKSNFVCEKKKETTEISKQSFNTQTIRLKPQADLVDVPPLVLTDFIFENLKLRHSEWTFPDWNFSTFELSVKENRPWYAEVKAKINLPYLEGIDTGAELVATYKEFPAQILETKVNGHWREGAFQVTGIYEGSKKTWTYESKFNHIPFQFLKTIAHRTKTPWNWPDKPMWFSFSTQTAQPFLDWKTSQHFVRNLEVEGDLGELVIPDLEIKSWNPFKVEPFAFTVSQADLNTIFDQELKKIKFLSSLGKLSGQGQWSSEKDLLFTGKIEKVQIPLFHKEQRMVQELKSFDLQAELKAGQWKMSSQKWQLDKGKALGNFHLESNQDISSGQMQFNLDELQLDQSTLKFIEVLSPQVSLEGKLSARWKKYEILDLAGQFTTDLIESRSFDLKKPQLLIKKTTTAWELKVLANQFKITDLSFGVPDPSIETNLDLPFESKNMNAQFQWDLEKNLKWSLNSTTIKSSGFINPQGLIKGTLTLGAPASARLNSKVFQDKIFKLAGSRKSPQMILLR